MSVTLYYNPKCSKSRQTLSLLEQRGIQPTLIEYLTHPPSYTKIQDILRLLNCSAHDLLRKKEHLYTELSLNDPNLDEKQLINAMIEHPQLIERQIVIAGTKAVVARPPEKVLEILS